MAVVVLGMECGGTEAALAALLDGGVPVRALVLAEPGGGGERPGRVARLATGAGVPVRRIARLGREEAAAIAGGGAEAVVAACFPWRVPATLLAVPPLGCLNVHPSLLPAGRGPEPVFWTLRRGERRTGATVHRMDAGVDTGPIVAQAAVGVPLGIRAPELERRLMGLGGRLLVEALPGLAAGSIAPTAQDEAGATMAPVPTTADWGMPTNLPARWAYGFARGVAPLGGPLAGPLAVLVGATGTRLPVRDALAWEEDGMAEAVVDEGGGVLRVRFRPGWVRFATGAEG